MPSKGQKTKYSCIKSTTFEYCILIFIYSMCRLKLNMEFFSENISMKMQFLQLSFILNIHFKVKFDWNELNYYASVVKYMGQEDREKESYYTFQYMMWHQKAFPFHRSRCESLSWLPANISSEYRICRIFPLLMCLLSLAL